MQMPGQGWLEIVMPGMRVGVSAVDCSGDDEQTANRDAFARHVEVAMEGGERRKTGDVGYPRCCKGVGARQESGCSAFARRLQLPGASLKLVAGVR